MEPANPESREAIGYRLELLRTALTDLTQEQIAESIGISGSAWNQFVKGKMFPHPTVAMRICTKYGVTTDWIYRGHTYAVPSGVLDKLTTKAAQSNPRGRRAS